MSFSNRALTLLGLCVSIILVGCEPHQNSDSSVSNATILTMPKPMRELLARNTIPIHGAIDQAAVARIPAN